MQKTTLFLFLLLGTSVFGQKKKSTVPVISNTSEWLMQQMLYPMGEINESILEAADNTANLSASDKSHFQGQWVKLPNVVVEDQNYLEIKDDKKFRQLAKNKEITFFTEGEKNGANLDNRSVTSSSSQELQLPSQLALNSVRNEKSMADYQPIRFIRDGKNPKRIFKVSPNGKVSRSLNGGFSFEVLNKGFEKEERFNYWSPLTITDDGQVYFGASRLYVLSGDKWKSITSDMSYGEQSWSLGATATISALRVNPNDPENIFVGTDDGRLSVTRDGGDNWQHVLSNLPARGISNFHFGSGNEVYVTYGGLGDSKKGDHVFKSADGVNKWQNISYSLPNMPVYKMASIEMDRHYLFCSNNTGVWYSINDGKTWNVLGQGLPFATYHNIEINRNTKTLYTSDFEGNRYMLDLSGINDFYDDLEIENSGIKVFPQPVNDILHVRTQLASNYRVKALLTDGKGHILGQFSPLKESEKQLSLDLGQIPEGEYVLKIKASGISESIAIEVKR